MKLFKLRIKVAHHSAYQPHNCTMATATGLFWDEENRRMSVELTYDNGALDWIPLGELGALGYYEIENVKS